jgi:hypothetical protein
MRRGLGILVFIVVLVAIPAWMLAQTDALPSNYPLPETVVQHVRLLYQVGQAFGNRPDVFSKIGDSITVSTNFLYPIGFGLYQLGEYTDLQGVIDYFSPTNARAGNSFNNPSLAAGVGWAAWGVLDPALSDAQHCGLNESPLECEYRLVRPSFALIMFGTNDVGYRTPDQYRADLLRIVEISVSSGVIPVLSTIPNRPDVQAQVETFNNIVRDITTTQSLPLWDYAAAMQNLPNSGLTWDNIHPSSPPIDGTAAYFDTGNLSYGYVVRNLTALEMLDALWRSVTAP